MTPHERPDSDGAPKQWPWISYQDAFWVWDADDLEDRFKVEIRAAIMRLYEDLPRSKLIWLAVRLREAVDAVLADLVAESRTEGSSWTRIGRSLGVGRTAAQKRFGKVPTERQRDELERETLEQIDYLKFLLEDPEVDKDVRDRARKALERLRRRRAHWGDQ